MIYERIVRTVGMPVIQRATGVPFWNEYEALRRSEKLSAGELDRVQSAKLRRLMSHAYQNCPIYRERMDEVGLKPDGVRGIADLAALRPVSKKDLTAAFPNRWQAQCTHGQSYIAKSTSGSTGTPFRFGISRAFRPIQMARKLRLIAWAGSEFGEPVSFIYSNVDTRPFVRKAYEWVKREQRIFMTSMDHAAVEPHARRVIAHRPRIIMGGLTSLTYFALHIRKHHPGSLRPVAVIPLGETIFPERRALLEDAYQCPVFENYGSNEIEASAQECHEHTGLHVNIDSVVLELIVSGRATRPGENGEILLTDLDNLMFPFIRYRIGDTAYSLNETCPCGSAFPMIRMGEGRIVDMMIAPSGRCLTSNSLKDLLSPYAEVEQFQFLQKRRDHIRLSLVLSQPLGAEILDRIRAACEAFAGGDVSFDVQTVKEIKPEQSGKIRYFKTDVPIDLSGL